MALFHGKFYYTLDLKGRFIIPAPLREIIAKTYSTSKLYITNAPFDKCLDMFPLEEWSRLEEKLKTLPKTDEAVKYFLRRVVASAVECEIDKQGRILVPYEHRQDAGINSDVVLVGMLDRIQIWDKSQWDAVSDPAKIDVKAFEATLSGFGI